MDSIVELAARLDQAFDQLEEAIDRKNNDRVAQRNIAELKRKVDALDTEKHQLESEKKSIQDEAGLLADRLVAAMERLDVVLNNDSFQSTQDEQMMPLDIVAGHVDSELENLEESNDAQKSEDYREETTTASAVIESGFSVRHEQ